MMMAATSMTMALANCSDWNQTEKEKDKIHQKLFWLRWIIDDGQTLIIYHTREVDDGISESIFGALSSDINERIAIDIDFETIILSHASHRTVCTTNIRICCVIIILILMVVVLVVVVINVLVIIWLLSNKYIYYFHDDGRRCIFHPFCMTLPNLIALATTTALDTPTIPTIRQRKTANKWILGCIVDEWKCAFANEAFRYHTKHVEI